MITKLKKFVPTEEGVSVNLKFPESSMPEIMRLYGQDVTIVPAQGTLPEEPTLRSLDGLADGIMKLAERFREQYKKAKGMLPEGTEPHQQGNTDFKGE